MFVLRLRIFLSNGVKESVEPFKSCGGLEVWSLWRGWRRKPKKLHNSWTRWGIVDLFALGYAGIHAACFIVTVTSTLRSCCRVMDKLRLRPWRRRIPKNRHSCTAIERDYGSWNGVTIKRSYSVTKHFESKIVRIAQRVQELSRFFDFLHPFFKNWFKNRQTWIKSLFVVRFYWNSVRM